MHRQSWVQTTASPGPVALASRALPGLPQPGFKTPLTVPVTRIPMAGCDLHFRLRRNDCTGRDCTGRDCTGRDCTGRDCTVRNCTAHARKMGSDPTRAGILY
jgi:hypothetical protein